ncbi:hypothetical protein [Enterococcus pallens]|uniref:Uncharacterized protein n=1 Tax=Enterococcus pallens ATCC BAA-351 TaxID=1158607 RepID=R2S3T9_9ENTE|nr:hypothetical protein [Enterococcus pallens]EOH90195.1 hypothetical protein UAU_04024 [Enterococcus pallens ATCC BAA-351]EOU15199.1 hypothetical protein I588_04131 [Enterococcus pallens ATCC BAA-351]
MEAYKETRQMTDHQIDTIILAAFAAKQQVTITQTNGKQYSCFYLLIFDQDGFSLTTSYIWWKDIQFVQPDSEFYTEWADVLNNYVSEINSKPI